MKTERMKAAAVLMLLLVVIIYSCKQKTYTCRLSYYHVPVNIGFTGFTADELDTLFVANYASNTAFSGSYTTDTFLYPNIVLHGDTAFINDSARAFFYVQDGTDYEIRVPATGSRFRLSGIHYPPDGPASEERSYQCHVGYTLYMPDSFLVNGQPANLVYDGVVGNLFLHK